MSACEHSTNPLEQIDELAHRIYEQVQGLSDEALALTVVQSAIDEFRKSIKPEHFPVDEAYRALATLSNEHVGLLLLSGRDGLHYTEIARRLQRTPVDVLRELRRARALFRWAHRKLPCSSA